MTDLARTFEVVAAGIVGMGLFAGFAFIGRATAALRASTAAPAVDRQPEAEPLPRESREPFELVLQPSTVGALVFLMGLVVMVATVLFLLHVSTGWI